MLRWMWRSRYTTVEGHQVIWGERIVAILKLVVAATTTIVRKVSNLRVWGLGRLAGFCNPVLSLLL